MKKRCKNILPLTFKFGGISKAKLSLKTGFKVLFLTCVFFLEILCPLQSKQIFTQGSARPVTSILGRFLAFNNTTVSRDAAGCQHKDNNSSPLPWSLIFKLLGWISLLIAICWFSICCKFTPERGHTTSPIISSLEYRSKLKTTKWRDIELKSASDSPQNVKSSS